MSVFFSPLHWRIIRREVREHRGCWVFMRPRNIYNLTGVPLSFSFDSTDIEELFGTSKAEVSTELFRVNGGKLGYYLANLISKEYHYCGELEQDVKIKLSELGIGVPYS
jgi:hypothetical protein